MRNIASISFWFSVLVVIELSGFVQTAYGQSPAQETYTVVFHGTPLGQALLEFTTMAPIDLVYSRDLVEGKVVYCRRREANVEVILSCMLASTGVDYVRSSTGTYILLRSTQIEPLYGNLAGIVYDAKTKEPLPFANVLLADGASGTSTNQDGLFSFASLLSGAHPVMVTYVGYKPAVDTILIHPGESNRHEFLLEPHHVQVDPILINGVTQRLPSQSLGSGELSGDRFTTLQGAVAVDALQGASRLAGIAIQQPIADLHIQGAAGNGHLTLLDGALVRNPVSLGRHLGAFSPLALQRIVIQKAGFEPRYGSHLVGRVDVEHDLSAERPFGVSSMLDPVSLNARLSSHTPLGQERSMTFMAAGRVSNWNVYEDRDVRSLLDTWSAFDPFITSIWAGRAVNETSLETIQTRPDVQFSDMHLAARVKVAPFHNLYVSGYRAINELSAERSAIHRGQASDTGADLLMLARSDYSWHNWAGQIRHSWLVGSRSVLTTQVVGSWHDSALSYRAYSESIDATASPGNPVVLFQDSLEMRVESTEKHSIRELGVKAVFNHSITVDHDTEFGFEAQHTTAHFDAFMPFVDRISADPSSWLLSGFAQNHISVGGGVVLTPGLRFTYVPVRRTMYAEPRVSIRFDGGGPALGDYAVRLSGGLYRQFVHQFELTSYGTVTVVPYSLFWLPVEDTVAPSKGYHAAIDWLLMPSPEWTVRAEAYGRWDTRIVTMDYARVQNLDEDRLDRQQADFVVESDGRAIGASLGAGYEGRRISMHMTYTLSEAVQRFPGRFEEERISTPWNVPHTLSADLRLRFASATSLEAVWTARWGQSWAFRRAYYDVYAVWRPEPQPRMPGFMDPEHDNLPSYSRVDLGLTQRFTALGLEGRLQLMVVNAFDRKHVFDRSLMPVQDRYQVASRPLPGRHLTLSLRIDY